MADRGNGIGDLDSGQVDTAGKSIVADSGDRSGDDGALTAEQQLVGR